jgi:hypothetical protein
MELILLDAYARPPKTCLLQGCNGIGLMLGYSNPWALWIRKQCEIAPLAVQGVYDLVLSMMVDVPFAKCICVDSRYDFLSCALSSMRPRRDRLVCVQFVLSKVPHQVEEGQTPSHYLMTGEI